MGYIPVIVRNALLQEPTRPRAEWIDDGIMLILRGVNMNDGSEPDDMVSSTIAKALYYDFEYQHGFNANLWMN